MDGFTFEFLAVEGQLYTTVCQAYLLMGGKGKFHQFAGLVDKCAGGDPSTTLQDLQGFWDMIFIQVTRSSCYCYYCSTNTNNNQATFPLLIYCQLFFVF